MFGVTFDFFAGCAEINKGSLKILDKNGLAKLLHTSPECYLESKMYFNENCYNMLDFLKWYNILDCKLLSEAIQRYAQGFLSDWKTNIHMFKSVSFFTYFDSDNLF